MMIMISTNSLLLKFTDKPLMRQAAERLQLYFLRRIALIRDFHIRMTFVSELFQLFYM